MCDVEMESDGFGEETLDTSEICDPFGGKNEEDATEYKPSVKCEEDTIECEESHISVLEDTGNGEFETGLPGNEDDIVASLTKKGLNEKVAEAMTKLICNGVVMLEDVDDRILEIISSMRVEQALCVIQKFKEVDLLGVSCTAAYLGSLMKTFRDRVKIYGLQEAMKQPLMDGPDREVLNSIIARTGYPTEVTIGQRKYGGPPPDYEGSPPGPGCEIYIGKIPKGIFEDTLIPLFEQCGKIYDIRVMMDPLSGTNKGYAFVTYCDKSSATEAAKKFEGYEIKNGKRLRVNVSVANTRLFVGNIPKSKGKEDIMEEFSKVSGVQNITDVIMYSNPNDPVNKKNRGFCFLEFADHKSASQAKRRLGSSRFRPWMMELVVEWAETQDDVDKETMSKVKILYLRPLKDSVSEEELRVKFSQYGTVERVKRIKDYAFVHFAEREQAEKAIEAMKGQEFDGVPCEVSFAKPTDRKRKDVRIGSSGVGIGGGGVGGGSGTGSIGAGIGPGGRTNNGVDSRRLDSFGNYSRANLSRAWIQGPPPNFGYPAALGPPFGAGYFGGFAAGAGIQQHPGMLTARDCRFLGNVAFGQGGPFGAVNQSPFANAVGGASRAPPSGGGRSLGMNKRRHLGGGTAGTAKRDRPIGGTAVQAIVVESENTDMGSKECLKDKLAKLFHLKSPVEDESTGPQSPEPDHALCVAIAKQLTESKDANDLVAVLQELIAVVEETRLSPEIVELLWTRVSQLISDECTLDEHRLTALEFLTTLTKVQYETLDKLRTSICLLLINPRKLKCDALPLLHLLHSLTKDGRDIRGLENQLGELIVQYMEFIPPSSASSFAFLELLQAVVNHHADTLDEKHLCNVLTYVCLVTHDVNSAVVKIICALNIVDLVRANAHMPSDCLAFVVHSLCKLVPRDDVFLYVWRTMQGLLNSSVGDAVIWHFCQIMQHIALGTGYIDMTLLQMARCVSSFPSTSSSLQDVGARDPSIIRSAVICASRALWGQKRAEAVTVLPEAVLPAMRLALSCGEVAVVVEVISSVRTLVEKHGANLNSLSWFSILHLLTTVHEWIGSCDQCQAVDSQHRSLVIDHFCSTVDFVQQLISQHLFSGSLETFYTLVEQGASLLDQNVVTMMLRYKAKAFSSLTTDFLGTVSKVMQMFFFDDNRTTVRVCAIKIFQELFAQYSELYPYLTMQPIASALISSVLNEQDHSVIGSVLELMLAMAVATAEDEIYFFEVMDIAQKFITDYLVTASSEPLPSEDELAKFAGNVQLVLNGLVNVLKLKFQTFYGSMVQRVLKLIIDTLIFQYERGICRVFLGDCRKMMLQFLLSLRCDSSCRCLAYLHERRVTPMANAFVLVDQCWERTVGEKANGHDKSQEQNSNAQRVTTAVDGNDSNLIVHFSINELWQLVLKAIRKERYWPALKQVFVSLKYLLHDRYFIQGWQGEENKQKQNNTIDKDDDDQGNGKEKVDDDCDYDDDADGGGNVRALCVELLRLIANPRRSEQMLPSPKESGFDSADMNEFLYPILAELVSYKHILSKQNLNGIAMATQGGIKSPKSTQAVIATTYCMLLIPDVMKPMMCSLISQLADLPYTPTLAIAVLELLDQLVLSPNLYSNFTAKHYLLLFTILSVCMNPFRFTCFIVARSFRSILRWYSVISADIRELISKSVLEQLDLSIAAEKGNVNEDLKTLNKELRAVCSEYFTYESFLGEMTAFDEPDTHYHRLRSASWYSDGRIVTVSSLISKEVFYKRCIEASPPVRELAELRLQTTSSSGQSCKATGEKDADDEEPALFKRLHSIGAKLKEAKSTFPVRTRSKDDSFIRSNFGKSYKTNSNRKLCKKHNSSTTDTTGSDTTNTNSNSNNTSNASSLSSTPRKLKNDRRVRHASALSTVGWDWIEQMEKQQKSSCFELIIRTAVMKKRWLFVPKVVGQDMNSAIVLLLRDAVAQSRQTLNSIKNSTKNEADDRADDDSASNRFEMLLKDVSPAGGGRLLGDGLLLGLLRITNDGGSCWPLANDSAINLALKMFDLIAKFETYKIGVVYVGIDQCSETEILANEHGSERYHRFLSRLGEMVPLDENSRLRWYLGGLDIGGRDGQFTYVWSQANEQVVFHVATLMPTMLAQDPQCTGKKLHIGNDFVTIVYNDSDMEYKIDTISGQLSAVVIVVRPIDQHTLLITLTAKDEIVKWLALKQVQVSDELAPMLCRQMAIRAELSARIWLAQRNCGKALDSNIMERHRQINRIKDKFSTERFCWTDIFQ
ncbi:Heterogeneous nuclear ribonucleoprotein Q [Trichinella pseudospiralis]|uniref:Heterogeneous nuclear ribonucleoprotein Q n=1 Tax=Trichinella pseudospiralis TaxID=6337 RepID=A0A0V1IKE3_TRIPS|nr:Heterogeneous nuclear ribonucleoprotein Q [Trichinella pseudospiralis]